MKEAIFQCGSEFDVLQGGSLDEDESLFETAFVGQ